jgi:tRNA-dihydrouridine synthase A
VDRPPLPLLLAAAVAADVSLHEMVTADAVLYGDRNVCWALIPPSIRSVFSSGGSDPRKLAEAARIGAGFGYDEINLNIGWPV